MNKTELISDLKTEVQNGKIERYYLPKTFKDANLELVGSWGGEGEGDKIGFVLKVTTDSEEFYIKVDGSYNSYDGSDYSWAEVYEVRPYEKTITAWAKV